MFTQLMKGVLALCVASSLSLVGTTATAAGTDRATTDQQQTSARAGGPCAKEWRKIRKAKRAENRADQRLTNARKAAKKADTRSEKRTASKKLKKAKKQERVTNKKVKRAKKLYRSCKSQTGGGAGGGTGGGAGGSTNPLQPACDAGLPQAICDALGQLPLPSGGGGASPIQALCDAGLPQAICDAATLPGPSGGASPIQALCDAGLPQAICDAAKPPAPGSSPLPDPGTLLGPVCQLGLPIPGVCATAAQAARAA